jgi:O-6-methylguanine DNA methyltransferase
VRGVPRGSVVSYGDVAAGVGRPRAARAVGNAMAKNPFPWVVPCHRVVKSDLSIGGFSGSPCRKGDLLRQEGIEADAKTGKIREKYRQARDR